MKKILTLFTALLLLGSMTVQATDYYVAGIGSWDPNAVKMSQVGESEMYTATFANLAANQQQFKVTKDGTWTVSYGWNDAKQNLSNISIYKSAEANSDNVSFTPLSATNNITIYFNSANHKIYVIDATIPYITIAAGTTIYYDLTEYTGSGINIYAPGAPTDWYSSTAAPISFDLSEDWVISSDITLFRSGPNDNWDNRKCATLPTAGQNQIVSTDGINCSWATYVGPVIRPTIKMHGDFLGGWATTAAFTLDEGDATASIELTIPVKGSKSFGMRIGSDDNWTSNGASITRTNKSAVIEAGTNNCSLNADIPGKYTFTWTFSSNTLTVTYPDLPEQFVAFKDLSTQILKDTKVTFEATSTGITNPVYTYFVKPEGGEYGSAVAAYTFNAEGNFVVKVSAEGDNTAAPVVAEENVSVYDAHTFTSGTTIFVDFSAVSGDAKGVNYPKANEVGVDYDAAGAGSVKTVTFSADVEWTTNDVFIKTEKAGWAALKFSIPGDGQNCAVVAADGASSTWTTLVPPPPTIKLHGDFTGSWANTDAFVIAGNEETASLALTIPAKGMKSFGVRIGSDDNWTSNGAAITRANAAAVITSGEGNCSLNADIPGEYIFTWTYASNTLSVTYPELPSQFVEFDGLASQILKGTEVAFAANSSGITNPVYSYFVKPEGGEYGSAVAAYTFNAEGNFVVKVSAEGDNTAAPVVAEENVSVYDAHTFTSGTTIFVDFSAVSGDAKGVNYPKANEVGVDYDAAGAGSVKTVTFSADVEWTTNDVFIKTEKAGWAALKFSIPGDGQNCAVVAANGASYSWSTFVPSTYFLKNNWNGGDWTWQEMTAVGDGTFHLENVVYGGHGINYNYEADDAGAVWKDYTKIKYMDGETAKLVEAFDEVNLVLDPANDTIWAEMAQKNNPVYTVASNSLALCDLGWAPTHPYKYTDMKKQEDGTYMWNHEDAKVILPSGEIKLKIVKDRSYDNGSWPASDFVYNIQRSGEYEITVHFNPWTKEITIDTTCVKPLNIQVPLYIKGSWNNWSATPMLLGGYNDKAIVTLSFAETGTYNFKLEDVKEKWYGDGQSFTRNNSSHKDIEAKDESATEAMTLQVDKAGDYLVTYFYDGELLLVQYPAIVPAEKIAPLSGKFTINAKGDTAVFSRGNLHYNYESDAWYAAENQYDALGDLNLRFGDATYTGSIDLFGWSSENSDFGKQWKYRDEEFAGDFIDWGTLFAGDEKKWSTLSIAEWLYLLGREDASKNKLWTILEIGPDSLSGLVLFPDNWEAPAGLTIKYGFYDLEKEEDLRANAFSYAQWESMEAAGAVFLPLAGQRAGFYGNNWTGSAETDQSNPLSNGYNWVDEANGMTYYWSSTTVDANGAYCFSVPGFNNTSWLAPMSLNRERRRGHPVRLVTRIPKVEYVDVRTGLNAGHYYTVCWNKTMSAIKGASLWSFIGKDVNFAYIQEESAPYPAGKPYIVYAESEKLEAILTGDAVDETALVANNGLHGTFSALGQADLDGKKAAAGDHDVYLVIGDELRRATGYALDGITPLAGNSLPAFRAYVVLDEITGGTPNQAPGKNVRSMPLHKDATQGFENLDASEKPIKVLIDGQLYILRGENIYNVNGQIVQ